MIFLVFFLSFNLISQNNKQNITFSSLDNPSYWTSNSSNNLKVISILDNDHIVQLKKLDQFAAKYKNRNVTFIIVTDKLNDSLYNSIKNEITHYQHLSKNGNLEVFNTYQTGMYKIFPMHLIVDKEGKIIYKKKGTSNNIKGKLAKRIDKMLDNDGKETKPEELQYTIR